MHKKTPGVLLGDRGWLGGPFGTLRYRALLSANKIVLDDDQGI